ncbi:MAG: thioredoxin family protein [Deltaproteobacteria bacterium]|nr:thioredoxin family protein [Deltaproteobacteria bacterium]
MNRSRLVTTTTKWFVALIAAHIALVSGAHASSENAASPTHQIPGSPWYGGSLTAALAEAKAKHKHVLLYWGAVWCPPCNELKSQVFSQEKFATLMRPMIAVALDGDSEEAQAWGEKLRVQGYPTVLLLAPDGQELMRLPTAVNMDEFEAALVNALKHPGGLQAALERGLAGTATPDDWKLLANVPWHEESDASRSGDLISKLRILVINIPRALTEERAKLVALLLTTLTGTHPQDAGASEAPKLAAQELKWLLSDPVATIAARSLFAYSTDVLVWTYPTNDSHEIDADQLWLKAATLVAGAKESSLDTRLWASVAPMQVYRARHPGEKMPSELRALVMREVARSDEAAKTSYERKAVITGAATLLRDIGDLDGARALLANELKHTDTPWYLLASAAHLEKAAGNDTAALALIAKARKAAKGRASKLQWTQADITMTASIQNPKQLARLTQLVKDFYRNATTLEDGFQGRNARTAAKVASAIQPFLGQRPIKKAIENASKRCARQKQPGPCRDHFSGLGQFLQ